MCGICGFYGKFSQPSFLLDMVLKIKHRGPDDHGIVLIDSRTGSQKNSGRGADFERINQIRAFDPRGGKYDIGLAQSRLSILDLSPSGHQPMSSDDGDVTIVYNGELYNFRELKKELINDGIRFKTTSDTEVLIKMYQKYGRDCLKYFNGIFAFALWDRKRRFLFLARDGLGVKPLYYTSTPHGFLFSSEIKALLSVPGFQRKLNYRSVLSYTTYLWCPAPETPFENVLKLEPGQAAVVKDGVIKDTWCHYRLPYGENHKAITPDAAAIETRRLVEQAVRRQMVSDVEVGSFLSGGLDSSAVTAYAKKYAPDKKFNCFTIDYQNPGGSEEIVKDLPYAKQVAETLGIDLNVITVGPEMADELDNMVYQLDEPQADPAPLNVLFISRLARKNNIKVLLSGAGGDDIFTGYRRHFALLQERYWLWMPMSLRKVLTGIAKWLPVNNQLLRRTSKAFQYADLEKDHRLTSYFFWLHPDLTNDVLSQKTRELTNGYSVDTPLLASLNSLKDTHVSDLDKMLYLETRHFLADHNLNYTDKMGMASGVEIRVPLLDPDLVSFAASLPASLKQKGKTGKWIFKKAMEGILPKKIIYRPKSGFGIPLRRWFKYELKELVNDVLSSSTLARRGVFDPDGVQRLRQMDHEGRVDAAYPLFSIMCFELWCRKFLDE